MPSLLRPVSHNKHQQKTEETNKRLLKSAFKVFVRDGFEAARLEDIAAEAGYTRGAFYAHYKNKEDLFFALLEQQAYVRHAQIHKLLASSDKQDEKMRTLCEYYVAKVGDRSWSMLILEFKLFAARHPKIRPRLANKMRTIREMFRREIDGLLPCSISGNSQGNLAVRVVLEALLHSLNLEQAYDPTSLHQNQVREVLRQVFNLLVNKQKLKVDGNSVSCCSAFDENRFQSEVDAPAIG